MTEIQVDRVQLIAAAMAMHMHARVRPRNNAPAIVMYLCNDIYAYASGTHAIRTHAIRTHAPERYSSILAAGELSADEIANETRNYGRKARLRH